MLKQDFDVFKRKRGLVLENGIDLDCEMAIWKFTRQLAETIADGEMVKMIFLREVTAECTLSCTGCTWE